MYNNECILGNIVLIQISEKKINQYTYVYFCTLFDILILISTFFPFFFIILYLFKIFKITATQNISTRI